MTELWIIDKGWLVIMLLCGTIGSLIGIIWRSQRLEVRALHQRVDGKADKADVQRHEDEIQKLFDRQREDFGRVMAAVQGLSRDVNNNHTTLLVEIAKRPTREELK